MKIRILVLNNWKSRFLLEEKRMFNKLFSSKKLTADLIAKYEKQGYNKHLITQAWEACQGSESKMAKMLESLQ